jgi:hypothetical protein
LSFAALPDCRFFGGGGLAGGASATSGAEDGRAATDKPKSCQRPSAGSNTRSKWISSGFKARRRRRHRRQIGNLMLERREYACQTRGSVGLSERRPTSLAQHGVVSAQDGIVEREQRQTDQEHELFGVRNGDLLRLPLRDRRLRELCLRTRGRRHDARRQNSETSGGSAVSNPHGPAV